MAVSLGMIFHELATNAAKYGALSSGGGRVLVDWSVADLNNPQLGIIWRETGGPSVTSPERRGFGSRLIERNVRHDLAGTVQMHYRDDGLSAEIIIPLNKEAA
ncbi:Blue-light-activated histidine kinase [compost metagenome]